jgi:carbon-monoxide dehydrogenase medium subunit
MKPAPFDYVRPRTLDEALRLLADADGDARPIAGGQSLVPLLALRMASPKLIVDIRQLVELKTVEVAQDHVRVGALTTWREIERSPLLAREQPLMVEAVQHIAHYQIRTRGTIGGSCVHADPAAEMPGVAMTCDAEFELASPRGVRIVAADAFFTGALTTLVESDELLVAVRFPLWPQKRRYAFQEFARRAGDFAIAGCAVFWDSQGDGRCAGVHLGVFGVEERPRRLAEVEMALSGRRLTTDAIEDAAKMASEIVEAQSDLHAPAAYRRALLRVLVERALAASTGACIGAAA